MRRFVKPGLTALALGVAALPVVLVVALGWYGTPLIGDPLGPGSGVVVVTILFYVLWLPGTVFALIWAFDRLGLHYAVEQRPPRAGKKTSRRQRAGLGLVAARDRARQEAAAESRRRSARQAERTAADAARARRPGAGSRKGG